jgi:hypothetical protein
MKTGGFNLPNLSGPSRSASRPGMGGDGGSNNDKSSALGGQSLSGGAGGGDSRIPENFDLDHPTFSAALGKDNSPFNPILKGLDHDKLKEAAATLGLNPRTIASQLQTQSPAQILQSMEGVGSEAATLQLLDKMSKDPKMSSALGGSAIMSSGGGKGVTKTAAAGPAFGFGAKTPAGGASEMGFDKVKKPGPKFDENGDIWHEGYKGTIFQIVSQKLDKTHERIQQLEWQTPLNRALMGLPKLKGQTSLIDRLPPSRGDSK